MAEIYYKDEPKNPNNDVVLGLKLLIKCALDENYPQSSQEVENHKYLKDKLVEFGLLNLR